MKRIILGLSGAIAFGIATYFLVSMFYDTAEVMFAFVAIIMGSASIVSFHYAIEGTRLEDYIANFYNDEEDEL